MSDLFAPHEPEEMAAKRPLADRLRPQALSEVVGQDHLLGEGGPIRRMVDSGRLGSMILWGPPGTGKTTIAHLLARAAGYEFQQLSAVLWRASCCQVNSCLPKASSFGAPCLRWRSVVAALAD